MYYAVRFAIPQFAFISENLRLIFLMSPRLIQAQSLPVNPRLISFAALRYTLKGQSQKNFSETTDP